jgi:hypothetical protein
MVRVGNRPVVEITSLDRAATSPGGIVQHRRSSLSPNTRHSPGVARPAGSTPPLRTPVIVQSRRELDEVLARDRNRHRPRIVGRTSCRGHSTPAGSASPCVKREQGPARMAGPRRSNWQLWRLRRCARTGRPVEHVNGASSGASCDRGISGPRRRRIDPAALILEVIGRAGDHLVEVEAGVFDGCADLSLGEQGRDERDPLAE